MCQRDFRLAGYREQAGALPDVFFASLAALSSRGAFRALARGPGLLFPCPFAY